MCCRKLATRHRDPSRRQGRRPADPGADRAESADDILGRRHGEEVAGSAGHEMRVELSIHRVDIDRPWTGRSFEKARFDDGVDRGILGDHYPARMIVDGW